MQIVCFEINWQNYIKTVAYASNWQQPKAMTFWHRSKWILKDWDKSILGPSPEFEFYKGRRFHSYGNKEWLPLGVA